MIRWTIYWTKKAGIDEKYPVRDAGYCSSDINLAFRALERSFKKNIVRTGGEWEGYIDEYK